MACWRVFKVAALALGIVSLAALQQYEKAIEKLTLQWPLAWGLIVLADDKGRAERLEKIRRNVMIDQQAGRVLPLDWDEQNPGQPASSCWPRTSNIGQNKLGILQQHGRRQGVTEYL